MGRSEEYARAIAEIDDRLDQLPPEEADERADLLERRRELTSEAAEDLAGEQTTIRQHEPQEGPAVEDRDLEAGG